MTTPGTDREIGVLALQGDFDAHRGALARCGSIVREVRLPEELAGLGGLVIPGGESTVLLRLMREYRFDEALPAFTAGGGALYGSCAGAILLARGVSSPGQWSLGLLDIDIERNAYGRQVDSFEDSLEAVAPELLRLPDGGSPSASLRALFIRAPRIRRSGPGVAVLASRLGEPVLVRQGRILASTFHPELTADTRIHRYFIEQVVAAPGRVRGMDDHLSSPAVSAP